MRVRLLARSNLSFDLSVGALRRAPLRLAVVTIAVIVAVTISCAALCGLRASQRSTGVSSKRAGRPAHVVEANQLLVSPTLDSVGGRQFPVIWVAPSLGSQPPPGLTAWPSTGSAAVSPALKNRLATLASTRYTGASTIGAAGLLDPDELIAWVVASPHEMPEAARRLEGFGPGASESRGAPDPLIRWELDDPNPAAVVRLIVFLVLLPLAIAILVVVANAQSRQRARRAATLRRLGVGTMRSLRFMFVEGVVASIGGAVIAAVLWLIDGDRRSAVPIIGQSMFPETRRLRVWQVSVVAAVVVVAFGLIVVVLGRRVERIRPMIEPARASRLRLVPVISALLALIFVVQADNPSAVPLLFICIVVAILGLTLAAPLIMSSCGSGLARAERVPLYLAGRRLANDGRAMTRPFAVLGLSLVVCSFLVSWLSLHGEATRLDGVGFDFAVVSLPAAPPGSLVTIRERLPNFEVAAFSDSPSGVVLDAPCSAVAAHAGLSATCDPVGSARLAHRLAAVLGVPGTVTFGAGQVEGSHYLVIGRAGSGLSARTRDAVASGFGTPFVHASDDLRRTALPFVRWIDNGARATELVTALAAILFVVDRTMDGRRRAVITLIGVTERRARVYEAIEFAAAGAVVWVAATVVGGVVCWSVVHLARAPFPWRPWSALIAGGALVVITVSATVGGTVLRHD